MRKLKAKSLSDDEAGYKLKADQGFTILEFLVVISIIVLVATIIIIPFKQFRDNQVLDNTVNDVLAVLADARGKTLSSEGDSQYGVNFVSDLATLFKGDTFLGAGTLGNEEIEINYPATLSTISLTGGGSSIVFERLTGTTANSGTIVISLSNSEPQTRTIIISSAGVVSLEL
ncbi:MAG TPA: prepilin-type N-terminal cleavage/methylation domain-containing protein [Candidatus Paceibacterota bacterium]